jgi:hypothetical protein
MGWYRMAGQEFYFSCTVLGMEAFEITDRERVAPVSLPDSVPLTLSSQTVGWVGEEQRQVEVWSARNGTLLKVSGGSDFFISSNGSCIHPAHSDLQEVTGLDREILLGPALVLALASRNIWSLHASAAIFKNCLCIFLGESGQGKSTLAAYLSSFEISGWRRAADDILPVTLNSSGVDVWPSFPQLKLPMNAQPGSSLPECIPLDRVFVLTSADLNASPQLQLLPKSKAAQILLSHTAGTRMFDSLMLARHLAFVTQVAAQIPTYQLIYPHRRDALPIVNELLENIC